MSLVYQTLQLRALPQLARKDTLLTHLLAFKNFEKKMKKGNKDGALVAFNVLQEHGLGKYYTCVSRDTVFLFQWKTDRIHGIDH